LRLSRHLSITSIRAQPTPRFAPNITPAAHASTRRAARRDCYVLESSP
jgi:hypothetical protein